MWKVPQKVGNFLKSQKQKPNILTKKQTSSNTSSNIFYPAYTYYTITTIYNHHSTQPYHLQLMSITQHKYHPIISCILTTTLQSKHNTNTHIASHTTQYLQLYTAYTYCTLIVVIQPLVLIPPLIPLQYGGIK